MTDGPANPPTASRWVRLRPWLPAGLVALAALLLYLVTLEPSVFWLDSGLYIAAAVDLGVPYPPGFPLWVLLAQPFVWLSHLTAPLHVGWWVNALSAVCGAAAAGLVTLTVQALFPPAPGVAAPDRRWATFAAVFSGAAFALSASLWAQSVNAEVYAMAAALAAGFVYVAARLDAAAGDPAATRRWTTGLAVVYGLSFGVHPLTVAFLPSFIVLMVRALRAPGVGRRPVLIAAGIFVACGLIPYLWIPIRSSMRGPSAPAMDWGNPETAGNFVRVVTASHWTGDQQNFSWFGPAFWFRAGEVADLAAAQFGWLGLALAAWGTVILARRRPALVAALAPAALLLFLLPTAYVKTKEFEPWYIPLYGMAAAAIGAALVRGLLPLIARAQAAGLRTVAAAALVLWMPVSVLVANLPWLDRSGRWEVREYALNLLRQVEDNAIVFTSGDNPSSTLAYLQVAEGQHPGVLVINQESLVSAWARENLTERHPEIALSPPSAFYSDATRAALAAGTLTASEADRSVAFGEWAREIVDGQIHTRPVYFLVPGAVRLTDSYFLTPRGMLYRVEVGYQPPAPSWFDLTAGLPGPPSMAPRAALVPDLQYKYVESQREAATGALRTAISGAAALLREGHDADGVALLVRAQSLLSQIRAWGRVPYQHPDGRDSTPALDARRAVSEDPADPALWRYFAVTVQIHPAVLLLDEWAAAEGARVRPPGNARIPAALAAMAQRGEMAPLTVSDLAEMIDRLMQPSPGAADDLDRRDRVLTGLQALLGPSPLIPYHRATIESERAVQAGPNSPDGSNHLQATRLLLERAARGFDVEAQGQPAAYGPQFHRAMSYARLFLLTGASDIGIRAQTMLSKLLTFPESQQRRQQIDAMMQAVVARATGANPPR